MSDEAAMQQVTFRASKEVVEDIQRGEARVNCYALAPGAADLLRNGGYIDPDDAQPITEIKLAETKQ